MPEVFPLSEKFIFKFMGLLCGQTNHPEVMKLKRVAVADWLLERIIFEFNTFNAMRQNLPPQPTPAQEGNRKKSMQSKRKTKKNGGEDGRGLDLDAKKQLKLHGMILKALVEQGRSDHAVNWMRRVMANRGVIPDRPLVMVYLGNRMPAEKQVQLIARLMTMHNFIPDEDVYAKLIANAGAEKNVILLEKLRKMIQEEQRKSLLKSSQPRHNEKHWDERIAESFMEGYAQCGMHNHTIALYDALPMEDSGARHEARITWLAIVSLFETEQYERSYALLRDMMQRYIARRGRWKGFFFNDAQQQKMRFTGDQIAAHMKQHDKDELAQRLLQFLDAVVGKTEILVEKAKRTVEIEILPLESDDNSSKLEVKKRDGDRQKSQRSRDSRAHRNDKQSPKPRSPQRTSQRERKWSERSERQSRAGDRHERNARWSRPNPEKDRGNQQRDKRQSYKDSSRDTTGAQGITVHD